MWEGTSTLPFFLLVRDRDVITREQAISLPHGTVLYHRVFKNFDGSQVRCRVTGKCRTWVLQPDYFRLPVKHGLIDCFYITPDNAGDWSIEDAPPPHEPSYADLVEAAILADHVRGADTCDARNAFG